MARATWYFDVISPFAYLHLKRLHELPAALEVEYAPMLFAGLLKHWEHKGPAEIPSKRVYTYRYMTWLAQRLRIPFKMPLSHPFNSLYALRLLVGAGSSPANVAAAFDMIWQEGRDLQNSMEIAELGRRLGLEDTPAVLADEQVKLRLKENTDRAISKGVFGVPTFLVGETLFWGQDSMEMMLDYLRNPGLFDTLEMQYVSGLPVGAARRKMSQ